MALEVGADDFMCKPVRPMALAARLRLHLRRHGNFENANQEVLVVGDLAMFVQSRLVQLRGEPIRLANAEFDILLVLARNKNTLVGREQLFSLVHPNEQFHYGNRSIDLQILRLRRRIEEDSRNPVRLKSVYGDGYMLSDQP
jgi:DNA-binding response OmpR family regulator